MAKRCVPNNGTGDDNYEKKYDYKKSCFFILVHGLFFCFTPSRTIYQNYIQSRT
jgi:hypothetical protein